MAEEEAQLRRARLTEAALMAASQKVIKTLTCVLLLRPEQIEAHNRNTENRDASMNACFPLLAEQEPDLMKDLKALCEQKYTEGIPVRTLRAVVAS